MPPKTRITREMILSAAFDIVRTEGSKCLNVRRIAQRLNCSTQPVLYACSGMEEIRAAVYAMADEFHSRYLLEPEPGADNPLLCIGFRYIRFAAEEKHLFRFLFQSDSFSGQTLLQLTDAPALAPVLQILCASAECTQAQAKQIFQSLFLTVHGYAALLANNDMPCDFAAVRTQLQFTFNGLLRAVQEECS